MLCRLYGSFDRDCMFEAGCTDVTTKDMTCGVQLKGFYDSDHHVW